MKKEIVMFTGNNCGKCNAAKVHLSNLPPEIKENVVITEFNVDKDAAAKDRLTNLYKSSSLPTFIIPGHEPLRGFDEHMGKIMTYVGL